jgi:hypothetical protein
MQFKQQIQGITIKYEQVIQDKDRAMTAMQEDVKIKLAQKDQEHKIDVKGL